MTIILPDAETPASPAELRRKLQHHSDALTTISPSAYKLVRSAWTNVSLFAGQACKHSPTLAADLEKLTALAADAAEEMLFASVNNEVWFEASCRLIEVSGQIAAAALAALTPKTAHILRDTADALAQLPHARINRADLHKALCSGAEWGDAQHALDAFARHVDGTGGDIRWLSRWVYPRGRVEVVAELRDAASSIEAVDAVVAEAEPLSAVELDAMSEAARIMHDIAVRHGIEAVVTGR